MPNSGSSPSNTAFTNLDFMRSVAVLLVSGSHLLLYTGHGDRVGWLGITGVCIFFVHTSLVLMWSLERDGHIGRFYVRRAFRIYPLWIAVLTLTLAIQLPMSPAYAPAFRFFHAGPKEILESYLLTFGLGGPARIVGASWTLPIEMGMYIFLPCLFVFARGLSAVWPLLVMDVFAMFFDVRTRGPLDSSLPMCVPYFLPGIMAYVLKRRAGLAHLPGWAFPPFLLGLAAADRPFVNFRDSWIFCLILGLSLPLFQDMTLRPIKVVSEYVARYSYGVYLTHIAAICVGVHYLRGYALLVRVGAFLLTFCGLPVLFYHMVERPMIDLGARLARHIGRSAPRNQPNLELEMVP